MSWTPAWRRPGSCPGSTRAALRNENAISAYAAAEQLWTLWDQELNLVYGSIRARMTEKEAETLRIAELEWMKERDQAAARAAEASPVPQNQTLESRRAMAEETRVRCYELMEEYEEILERMPDGASFRIKTGEIMAPVFYNLNFLLAYLGI